VGNIGTPELFVVLIVALLVLGPNRLPQAARSFGKAMAEFRRVTGGLQAEMRDAVSHLENELNILKDDPAPAIPPAAPYVFDPPSLASQPGYPAITDDAAAPEVLEPAPPAAAPEPEQAERPEPPVSPNTSPEA
jgi:Tat protein translocase TatB subunit